MQIGVVERAHLHQALEVEMVTTPRSRAIRPSLRSAMMTRLTWTVETPVVSPNAVWDIGKPKLSLTG